MKHKHKDFNIITTHFKDKPARVNSITCRTCNENQPELIEIFQKRQNDTWKLYGNQSPMVWYDESKTKSVWQWTTDEEIIASA